MGQCYVCLPAPEIQSPWLLDNYCKELGGYQSWLQIIDESIPIFQEKVTVPSVGIEYEMPVGTEG